VAAGESDDAEITAWAEELGHAPHRCRFVHVVKRGDSGDDIERSRCERICEEVPMEILDAISADIQLPSGEKEAFLVRVDAGDVVQLRAEPSDEPALATAHIECVRGVWGYLFEELQAVMDVVVPAVAHGQVGFHFDQPAGACYR
jgi:hypothetical protein